MDDLASVLYAQPRHDERAEDTRVGTARWLPHGALACADESIHAIRWYESRGLRSNPVHPAAGRLVQRRGRLLGHRGVATRHDDGWPRQRDRRQWVQSALA